METRVIIQTNHGVSFPLVGPRRIPQRELEGTGHTDPMVDVDVKRAISHRHEWFVTQQSQHHVVNRSQ